MFHSIPFSPISTTNLSSDLINFEENIINFLISMWIQLLFTIIPLNSRHFHQIGKFGIIFDTRTCEIDDLAVLSCQIFISKDKIFLELREISGIFFLFFFFGRVLLSLFLTPAGDCSKNTRAQSINLCRGDKVRTCDNVESRSSSAVEVYGGRESPNSLNPVCISITRDAR